MVQNKNPLYIRGVLYCIFRRSKILCDIVQNFQPQPSAKDFKELSKIVKYYAICYVREIGI
jgi:hypothetical protein